MLRALGFRQKNLVYLIAMQATAFSMPGMLGGLLVAYFLNIITRYIVFMYACNISDYDLSKTSIWLGFLIGTTLPLISNILPI